MPLGMEYELVVFPAGKVASATPFNRCRRPRGWAGRCPLAGRWLLRLDEIPVAFRGTHPPEPPPKRSSDPNDLVQEAFVRTLRGGSLSRLEYPETYLRTAIYHLAVSTRRRRATGRGALMRVGVADPPPEYPWQLDELLRLSPRNVQCCICG